jgi:hypothetical protein
MRHGKDRPLVAAVVDNDTEVRVAPTRRLSSAGFAARCSPLGAKFNPNNIHQKIGESGMNRTVMLAFAAYGVLLNHMTSGPVFGRDAPSVSPVGEQLAQAEQPAPAPQAQPDPQQRAALIKQQLQASQAKLRAYEWIETTVVSKDGKQSARTQKRCYYGADGKLQKIVLEQTAGKPAGGPLMRHAAEQKQKEMTAYMQKATDLIHVYVPPVPSLMQRSIDSGKFAVQMLEPGRRARLNFGDYLKPGDSLGIEIDVQTNRPMGLSVGSYLDAPEDPVRLGVMMSVLTDGTIYVQRSQLAAEAKGLVVVVENSGHRRMQP